jgi:hypothetical protein
MASLDLSAASNALKEYYAYNTIAEMAYTKNPLLGMIPKDENMAGKKIIIPIEIARPLGRGVTIALAQAAETASNYEQWEITWVKNYGSAKIDGDVAEVTQKDKGAFMNLLTSQIDGVMKEVSRDLARNLYRSSSGVIGQINTTDPVASATLTLLTAQDASNFEVGMRLTFAATATGAVVTGGATGEVIAGINRSTGTLTSTSQYWGTVVTGMAASLYIYIFGDAQNGGTAKKIQGLNDWLPATITSAAFNGVDRSVDSRLWGLYYDGSSEAMNEALIKAQSKANAMHGAEIEMFMMNPADKAKLVNLLGSKVHYEGTQVLANGKDGPIAHIGFKQLMVDGDNGPISIVSDFNCPAGYAYGLTMDKIKLWSVNQAPHILTVDGLRIRVVDGEDAYRVRCGYYAQLAIVSPQDFVRVVLPS